MSGSSASALHRHGRRVHDHPYSGAHRHLRLIQRSQPAAPQRRAKGTHQTQQAAWQQAKQIAQQHRSEALLHGRSGQIRERTYEHDPRRTKG
jgi:hypothetical protein